MIRKLILPLVMLLFVIGFVAACAVPGPEAADTGSEDTASENTTDEEVTADPTEAPAEEPAAEVSGDAAAYTVDTGASTVNWFGSKPVGSSESGTIEIAEGQMSFAGDQFVDGTITIDMTTIATDSKTGNMAADLVGHLASEDFFEVETYPTSVLVIKSAEATGTDGQYLVKADLTIKETTKEIEFTTDVTVGDGTITATADIVIDRSEFNVRFGSGSFFDDLGDNLISDEIEMSVSIVASS